MTAPDAFGSPHDPRAPERDGPLLLAIESSCDETAAAVLDGTRSLRSSVVHSQIDIHAQYGGVVPELASRNHVLAIGDVVRRALDEAGITARDLSGVAVTRGPGLTGSLLVGVEFAKGLAGSLDLPILGVHHLEGHLLAARLGVASGFAEPVFPCVALLVSGGHTSLYAAEAPGVYRELGRTLDDAAGEAFDKISKRLGLGYPGGAVIDGLAELGRPDAIDLPRPMLKKGGYDFSFSGIKTAVTYWIDAHEPLSDETTRDLAASFREAACEVLVAKSVRAARRLGYPQIVISGGVACNRRLRSMMLEGAGRRGISVAAPPPSLCTDNAAMIGAAGYGRLWAAMSSGAGFEGGALDATSSWSLGPRAA